jgi:hypothetical protein
MCSSVRTHVCHRFVFMNVIHRLVNVSCVVFAISLCPSRSLCMNVSRRSLCMHMHECFVCRRCALSLCVPLCPSVSLSPSRLDRVALMLAAIHAAEAARARTTLPPPRPSLPSGSPAGSDIRTEGIASPSVRSVAASRRVSWHGGSLAQVRDKVRSFSEELHPITEEHGSEAGAGPTTPTVAIQTKQSCKLR